MPHFFISYAKKDTRELALALNDALNVLPIVSAWVDRSLKAGKSWELQIQSEIDKCDYFVVLYSPDINRHKLGQEESYVLTEIAYAKYQRKKPIIPVMAQATESPISLTTLHYIDFTISGLGLQDLVEAICDEAGIFIEQEIAPPVLLAPEPRKSLSRIYDVLPHPFDWCQIPAGSVKLEGGGYVPETGQIFDVPAFSIAKYPITNAQFAKFVEAGGYKDKRWWSEFAWGLKEKGYFWDRDMETWRAGSAAWAKPAPKQRESEHPVVGVSWYEALAFCYWLGDAVGENIMLPTEQQWQRAAQGDDGREYPWGNRFYKARANTFENGIKGTRPVGTYPNGASPYKVIDMVGNAWEWCLTASETGANTLDGDDDRILRGGAYIYDMSTSSCSVRNNRPPALRNMFFGFRIALT